LPHFGIATRGQKLVRSTGPLTWRGQNLLGKSPRPTGSKTLFGLRALDGNSDRAAAAAALHDEPRRIRYSLIFVIKANEHSESTRSITRADISDRSTEVLKPRAASVKSAPQRSGTRQQNVSLYHSGRQASASTPSASPGSGQGRSRAFQLRPASSDLKSPWLLAA